MPITTRKYKDIDLDFEMHPVTGDISKKIGDAAIITSMKNLLQTGKYERLFQPDLHSRLREHLFEPIDGITSSAIETEIRTTIGRHEPRVDLFELIVTPDHDAQGYSVSMSFFIVNRADPITITLFLERIR